MPSAPMEFPLAAPFLREFPTRDAMKVFQGRTDRAIGKLLPAYINI